MNRTGNKARFSPPSEDQARAWLAWLASGMRREGQTIFQLEQLQPSWLASSWRRWGYYLASRSLEGAMRGLTFGHLLILVVFIFDPSRGGVGTAAVILALWLLVGLYLGLVGGAVDRFHSSRKPSSTDPGSPLGVAKGPGSPPPSKVLSYLLFGGATLLPFIPSLGPSGGIVMAVPSTIAGLLLGRFWLTRNLQRTGNNDIQPIETLRISWAGVKSIFQARAYSQTHWLVGIFVGALALIPISLSLMEYRLLVIPALAGALLVVQAVVVKPGIRELKTNPNQGILLSARNGLLVGGLYGTCIGALSYPLMRAPSWQASVLTGVTGAVLLALKYGGLEAAKHYLLRLLLWRSGAMPWRYADFLDYAAEELHLIQKVGGGYIFIHRYLLEHFAAMPTSQAALTALTPAERSA